MEEVKLEDKTIEEQIGNPMGEFVIR